MGPAVIKSRFYGNVAGGVNSDNIEVKGPVYGDVNINSKAAAESRKKLAEWVSPLDFSSIHAQALGKRTPGTLEWLIASPAFKIWRNRRGGFLWCPGPPGAGKTVFASFVINQLQKARNKNPQVISAICYIYCQYSNRLSVLQLFEVILRQLILSCPSVEIEELERMKDEFRRPPLDEIISILQSNFRSLPGTFVVVDALDECFSEADRHYLLQKLRAFSDVNILTTSRDLPHIAEAVRGVARLDIRAIEGDVNIHLDFQRQRNPRFARLAAKLSGPNLTSQVLATAGDSFLLADLHISYLSDQNNTNDLKRALDALPTDAAASHASAIGRIDQQNEQDRRLAYTVLSLVSSAFRPFKSLELRHAVASMGLDKGSEDGDLADQERIVSVCAGLIMINKVSTEVGLIHYTVQEYLQQARQRSEFLSQSEITKSLMHLISSFSSHPLLDYAASSWPHHVRLCEDDESVLKMALSLLADSKHAEMLCSKWDPYQGVTCSVEVMHLLAAFGLTRIAKLFLQRNPQCTDQRDCKGRTPLSWAAGEGHLDTVLMLLEGGIVRTLPIETTPLKPVRRKSLNEITRLVLQKVKVKVNRKDQNGRTSLSSTAENGHLEVANLLTNIGKVEINAKDNYGRTPLSYASGNGHSKVVMMLINTGKVQINVKDDHGRTPLSYAAENGHLEVLKMLLSTGKVKIDARDYWGRTPLSYAAQNGNLRVVKMLLDTGKVDVDASDVQGCNPLRYARQHGHVEIVKLLKDYYHLHNTPYP